MAIQEALVIACLYSLVYQLLLLGALAANTGDVRLVNDILNSTVCEGRLELKFNEQFVNGWFAVCDGSFGPEEIQVVCHQLGCNKNGHRTHISMYGELPTDAIAYQRDCTGNEVDLLRCNEAGYHICHDTRAEHYVGIVCNQISYSGVQTMKSLPGMLLSWLLLLIVHV